MEIMREINYLRIGVSLRVFYVERFFTRVSHVFLVIIFVERLMPTDRHM